METYVAPRPPIAAARVLPRLRRIVDRIRPAEPTSHHRRSDLVRVCTGARSRIIRPRLSPRTAPPAIRARDGSVLRDQWAMAADARRARGAHGFSAATAGRDM